LVIALAIVAAGAALCAGAGLALARRHARTVESLRGGLERDLEERTRALRRAEEELHRAEKLAAVGQFAAGVAHRVNGPAAAIGSALRYLREALEPGAPAPPDALVAVHEAEAALERIAATTRQLRDASRLAQLPARADAATELDRAAREAVEVARARAPAPLAPAPIDLAVPPELWVAAEPDVVIEVLACLVSNALEAVAGSSARIRLDAERQGDAVRIRVEDGGPGMAPEVLRRVFEPFFTTKPDPRASGLGLAVSRGLVASAGGELRLESEPGRGTRALVTLPATPPPPIAAATTPAPRG
jgi:C4-dicarboxylate-specific signal transduction histidine kinase